MLIRYACAGKNPAVKQASVVILDMPAVVHVVKPQRASVFGEFTTLQLLSFVQSQIDLNTCITRTDAVWDRYPQDSVKNQVRMKRIGKAPAKSTTVSEKVPIPKGNIGRHS